MITHYKNVFSTTGGKGTNSVFFNQLNENAQDIFRTLENYEGRNRTGDKYVRTLFDCALLYFVDKFGLRDISKAVEKIFIWAYTLRLTYQAVQIASMDNHVLQGVNMFAQIKEAINPHQVFNIYLEPVKTIESSKTGDIELLFEFFRYYDNAGK